MSEEPEQNPRTEASKKKLNDAFELHKHIRASIGLNPFNILQRMKGGLQNFRAQQAQQNQASGGNPGNPSNQGVQTQYTNSSRIRLDLGFGVLHPKPQPQAPPPPTEEEKRAMAEQQKLKELEDKQKAEKQKRRRLDTLSGLSVDRS